MRAIDIAKALNLALVACVIFADAKLVAGHGASFHNDAAPRIATGGAAAGAALAQAGLARQGTTA